MRYGYNLSKLGGMSSTLPNKCLMVGWDTRKTIHAPNLILHPEKYIVYI